MVAEGHLSVTSPPFPALSAFSAVAVNSRESIGTKLTRQLSWSCPMENALQDYLSKPGGILFLILMIPLSGLIIGGLARWIMPGPDPMSIGKTILLGIAGSLVGGLVAAIFRLSPTTHPFWVFLLEVGGALLLLAGVRYRRKTTGNLRLR